MTVGLRGFVLDRLEDDEMVLGVAERLAGPDVPPGYHQLWNGVGQQPALSTRRLRAEIAAKRALIEGHGFDLPGEFCSACNDATGNRLTCDVLPLVASVWAPHPRFDRAWLPAVAA